jgi:hypothetical protein
MAETSENAILFEKSSVDFDAIHNDNGTVFIHLETQKVIEISSSTQQMVKVVKVVKMVKVVKWFIMRPNIK